MNRQPQSHHRTASTRPGMQFIVGLALAAGAALTGQIGADEFTWTGDCESASPFACCQVDPQQPCLFDDEGDPIAFLFTNNWGEIGPCGVCPSADQFPGEDDDIDLNDGVVPLDGGTFTFGSISSDADAGGLIMTNAGLVVPGLIDVFSVDMTGGSITTEGTLQVSQFCANFGQTLSAAEYLFPGLVKLGQPGAGGTSHTFNDGKVVSQGQVIWEAGSISTEGGWNHIDGTFEINTVPGQFNRSFNGGGSLINNGLLEIIKVNPDGPGGEVNFNVPVETVGTNSLIVTSEWADVRFDGGGVYDSLQPFDMFGNSKVLFSGSFMWEDGTHIRDMSDPGDEPTTTINSAIIPNDAAVTIEPPITVNNNGEFNVLGILTANSLQLQSFSDVNGGNTGVINTQHSEMIGQAIEINDVDLFTEDAFTYTVSTANGVTSNNSTINANGASGTASGKFVLNAPGENEEAVLGLDSSTITVNDPVEVTGSVGAAGFQGIVVSDSIVNVNAFTELKAFVNVHSGGGNQVIIGCTGTAASDEEVEMEIFSELVTGPLDTITVCEKGTLTYGGAGWIGEDTDLIVQGILQTTDNQNNPVNLIGGSVHVLPGAAALFHDDSVHADGTHITQDEDGGYTLGDVIDGTYRGTSCSGECDEEGDQKNAQQGEPETDISLAGQTEIADSNLTIECATAVTEESATVTVNGSTLTLACVDLINDGLADFFDTVIEIDGPATITGAGTTNIASVDIIAGPTPGNGLTFGPQQQLAAVAGQSEFQVPIVGPGTIVVSQNAGLTFGDGTAGSSLNELLTDIVSTVVFKDSGNGDTASIDGDFELTAAADKAWAWQIFIKGVTGGVLVQEVSSPLLGEINGPTLAINRQFAFAMTDESQWQWEPGTVLSLTGGVDAPIGDWENWTRLEIGGTDFGDDPQGFDNNFDLSILRIGEGAHAFLEDTIDNGNRGGGGGAATGVVPEALYVDVLEFADATGQLNVNGLNIYFGQLIGDPAQIIDTPVIIDCPADLTDSGAENLPDGEVNVFDLIELLLNWNTNGPGADIAAPFDVVDVFDLIDLLAAWGPCD